jgi:hypothetical protein
MVVALLTTFIVIREYRSVEFGNVYRTHENAFGFQFFSLNLNSTASFSFGAKMSLVIDFLITLVIFTLCVVTIKILKRNLWINEIRSALNGEKSVWILGSSFLFCYFTSMNFDYRLALLLVIVLNFVSQIDNVQISTLCLCVSTSIMWLTFPSGQLQLFGDLLTGIVSCFLFIYFVSEFRNSLAKLINT